jgi:hypothetical protein
MRIRGLTLAATLLTTACSLAGPTPAEFGTSTANRESRPIMRRTITEPRVATAVAAIATGRIALEEDSPGLVEQARVSDANARVLALQRVPGGRVVEAELEEERGRLVYSYEIRLADGRGVVEIDATTGAVVREQRKEAED